MGIENAKSNSHKSGGRFRKKRYNFSMVSNSVLQDPKLSLKAKGLYSVIQSLITLDNDVYKWQIMKFCQEGETAFENAWKELKEKGYLKVSKMRDPVTNVFFYEYDLLEIKEIQEFST